MKFIIVARRRKSPTPVCSPRPPQLSVQLAGQRAPPPAQNRAGRPLAGKHSRAPQLGPSEMVVPAHTYPDREERAAENDDRHANRHGERLQVLPERGRAPERRVRVLVEQRLRPELAEARTPELRL